MGTKSSTTSIHLYPLIFFKVLCDGKKTSPIQNTKLNGLK